MDVLNARVPPLTMRTAGRGYLCKEGDVAECQIVVLEKELFAFLQGTLGETKIAIGQNEIIKEEIINQMPRIVSALGQSMRDAWNGELPEGIHAMEKVLELGEFEVILQHSAQALTGFNLPLGVRYEDLRPLVVDIRKEGPFWTVLGGRQSGKSTFLTALAYLLKEQHKNKVQLTCIPFRRGPLSRINPDDDPFKILTHPEDVIEEISSFADRIQNQPDKMHVILMDDVGLAFSGGNAQITQEINQLGDALNMIAHDNFLIVIGDLYSNLKSPQTYGSSFIKQFQQSQTGVFFSIDDADMQWFNTRVSLMLKKTLKWMPGRGFYVSKGETEFMQCPWVTPEQVNELQRIEAE
jgi:energy-coupling factor transporter ATP-binding protein EcfA2